MLKRIINTVRPNLTSNALAPQTNERCAAGKHSSSNMVMEGLETRTLMSATPVSFGDGSAAAVRFVDGDGTAVVVALRGGAGTIDFGGDSVAQTTVGRTVVVTGNNLTLDQVTIDNAVQARMAISGRGGDGFVDLGSVTVNGSLQVLAAKTTHFLGRINVSGDVGQVVLGSAAGTIAGHGTLVPMNVVIYGAATDLYVLTSGRVGVLKAASWSDSDGTQSYIMATGIDRLVVAGSFNCNVDLSGGGLSLGAARIGSIESDRWSIPGDVGSIATDQTSPLWTADIGGRLGAIRAASISGNINANSIGGIAAQALISAHINLSESYDGQFSLGKLSAREFSLSSLHADDNIGAIAIGLVNTSVFAVGAGTAASLPQSGDFTSEAMIRSFRTSVFDSSAVAAGRIGSIGLGQINETPGELAWIGVAAKTIGAIGGIASGHKFSLRNITALSDISSLLSAQHALLTNLQIEAFGFPATPPSGRFSDPGNDLARINKEGADVEMIIKLTDQATTLYSYVHHVTDGTEWQPLAYDNVFNVQIRNLFNEALFIESRYHDRSLVAGMHGSLAGSRLTTTLYLRGEADAISWDGGSTDPWVMHFRSLADEFDALVPN